MHVSFPMIRYCETVISPDCSNGMIYKKPGMLRRKAKYHVALKQPSLETEKATC